ncbi:unnamed protein product [Echinostoma caproni]|uniref:MCM_N domain-containing protein n=1 Tax=Echinostoma caproni TaxID=27848 RepID=A0A183BAY6_9TREM|nr:unnamed protein product [Echinostoma caproni]
MAKGNIASTDEDSAETLMDYFKSVYRPFQGNGVRNPLVDTNEHELQMVLLREDKMRTKLRNLSKHEVVSPDEIHPAIVQPLAEVTELFKTSLNSGVVPDD